MVATRGVLTTRCREQHGWLTVNLFQDSDLGDERGRRSREKHAPIEVIFQCEILGHEYSLTILFHHVEVVRRVHAALEQNPAHGSSLKRISRISRPRTCWLHT